jgi:hypothetical protein
MVKIKFGSFKDRSLTERIVLLNDQILELTPDDNLPELKPVITDPMSTLTLKSYGIAFWVFVDPVIGSVCQ